jgi:hypothetical protein
VPHFLSSSSKAQIKQVCHCAPLNLKVGALEVLILNLYKAYSLSIAQEKNFQYKAAFFSCKTIGWQKSWRHCNNPNSVLKFSHDNPFIPLTFTSRQFFMQIGL